MNSGYSVDRFVRLQEERRNTGQSRFDRRNSQ
jgi:hypothetical protein